MPFPKSIHAGNEGHVETWGCPGVILVLLGFLLPGLSLVGFAQLSHFPKDKPICPGGPLGAPVLVCDPGQDLSAAVEPLSWLWLRVFGEEKLKRQRCLLVLGSEGMEHSMLPPACTLLGLEATSMGPQLLSWRVLGCSCCLGMGP